MTTEPRTATRVHLATAFLALGALWFILCRQLSGEWSVNEQYTYGWFVPFFAAFLFWLRWEDRPEAESRGQRAEIGGRKATAIGIAVLALLVLFPLRLFEVANPDWRPLSWLHTAAVVALSLLVIWSVGGTPWLRHFAFPVCFIFVAVPWISPIEEPVVQGLMRLVAAVASEAITLCGIPAQVEGNLIRVDTGLVGVSEACSGVRSLQTSLMIGLLFGELKRFSVPRRIALVLGAVALAMIANFARAFFLVWVAARQGIPAVDRWHDFAGYSIVALVFVGSLALSVLLGKSASQRSKLRSQKSDIRPPTSDLRLPIPAFILVIVWLLALEIGVELWYRGHESQLVERTSWTARWPKNVSGFHEIKISGEVKGALRFDEGREASWKISISPDAGSLPVEPGPTCFLFFFRWQPGTTTILRARAHRPDICLPSSGWHQLGDHGIRDYRAADQLTLPFRHFSFGHDTSLGYRPAFAHAFFCLREDKVSPSGNTGRDFDPKKPPTNWVASDRWRVVRDGIRNPGQQVMEFVLITREEVGREEAETRFAALVPELVEMK